MKKSGTPTGTAPGSASETNGSATVGAPAALRWGAGAASSCTCPARRSGEIVFCECPGGLSHAATGSAGAEPSLLKEAPRCWASTGAEDEQRAVGGVPGGPANPPNGSGDVMMGADAGAGCCVVCTGAGAGDVSVVGAAGARVSGAGVVAVVVPVGAGAVVVPVGVVVVDAGVVVGAGVVVVAVCPEAGGGVVLVVAVSACAAGGGGASLAAGLGGAFGGAGSCTAETAVSAAPAASRLPPKATAMTAAAHRPAASRLRLGRLLAPCGGGGVMSGGLLAMASAWGPAEGTVLPPAFAGTSVTVQPPTSIDSPGG
jgi:hypothetical protein